MLDIFNLGCNTALRISDLLALKPEHLVGDHLSNRAQKTGKAFHIQLNAVALEIVERRAALGKPYLFCSDSNRADNNKPVSRQALGKVLTDIGEEFELRLGTHSMRKTFGYHAYKRTNNLGLVQKHLQHRNSSETLRYIGIEQDELNILTTEMVI